MPELSGLILLNKPVGISSRNAAARTLRALPKGTKFGHVGTLDPAANGVLPVLIGKATKCMDFLHSQTKAYKFKVKLGVSTTTMDIEGDVVEESSVPELSYELLNLIARKFVGKICQVPPIYSAIKWLGKPLYEYARSGKAESVDLNQFSREIEIYSLDLEYIDENHFEGVVRCSKGTYVRVLGVDIAKEIGTLGHVVELCRMESSGFKLEDTVEATQTPIALDFLSDHLIPISKLPFIFPSWKSRKSLVKPLLQGQKISLTRDEFFASIIETQSQASEVEDKLLLLDDLGTAFGIGKATLVSENEIQLRMNKGLL